MRLLLIILSLFILSASPADKNAIKLVQDELNYFNNLQNTKKVLSGQFIGWLGEEDVNKFQTIYAMSQKYPAIMSSNYADFGKNIFEFDSTNTYLINQWYSGGLIEVGIHFNNPTNNEWDINTPVDFNKVIKFGTNENINFNIQLDRISIGLQELQNANTAVLFRPFMESNGYWFWWGQKDKDDFINLWKYTFNYLTEFKHLHNLLWVYSINVGYGDVLSYYPGDDFVDIVGLDYYSSDGVFEETVEYRQLLKIGKPIVLSELGQCRSSGFNCYPKDAHKIIESIEKNMPMIVYWNNWNGDWALDEHFNVYKLLSNPKVINRGDISFRKKQ